MELGGLSTVNVELVNFCNKNCHICKQRQLERNNPIIKANMGEMEFNLVKKISEQLPSGIVVQLHLNGEGLLYSQFGKAAGLFNRQITNLLTNSKLILEKFGEIISHIDTLTISIVQDDPEWEEQYEILKYIATLKGNIKLPNIILRINGKVDFKKYEIFGFPIAKREIHNIDGKFDYIIKPIISEIGICLDMISHLVITKDGKIYPCPNISYNESGLLGNIKDNTLVEIWNGKRRKEWIKYHIQGRRDKVEFCKDCQYFGIPTCRG